MPTTLSLEKSSKLRGIKQLLTYQLAFCLLLSLMIYLRSGQRAALSILLGGLVAIIPTWIFAKKLFRFQGARAARQIVQGFYAGEFLKIITSVMLFTVVFSLYPVVPLVFFLTYITILMTHWFAPLVCR